MPGLSIRRFCTHRQRRIVTAASLVACVFAGGACLLQPGQARAADEAPETAHPCVPGADAGQPRILVDVMGVRRVAGNVTYTLYGDQPGRFLVHKGSIALERVTLTGLSSQGCFVVSRPGTYAVAIYHDENNNHHFDRSLLGLPEEGYGFSRNAPIFMAPPSFGAVRFDAGPGDTRLTIALRY